MRAWQVMTHNPLNIAVSGGVQLHVQNVSAVQMLFLFILCAFCYRASGPLETPTLCNTLHDLVISALALRAVPFQAHTIGNKIASISRFYA